MNEYVLLLVYVYVCHTSICIQVIVFPNAFVLQKSHQAYLLCLLPPLMRQLVFQCINPVLFLCYLHHLYLRGVVEQAALNRES